jgi:hypothetical protein
VTEEVGQLMKIGELRKPMKIREGTRKAQPSVSVLNGGSETRSDGPSIRMVMQ